MPSTCGHGGLSSPVSLARGRGFLNRKATQRSRQSSPCHLSEPGGKHTWPGKGLLVRGQGQLPVSPRCGGHPKPLKMGQPGGAAPGVTKEARPLLRGRVGHGGGCAGPGE